MSVYTVLLLFLVFLFTYVIWQKRCQYGQLTHIGRGRATHVVILIYPLCLSREIILFSVVIKQIVNRAKLWAVTN